MPIVKFGSLLLAALSAAGMAACGSSSTSGAASSGASTQTAPAVTSQPTGTPVPLPEPSSQVPFADCSSVTFGPALGPINPPPNVHQYSAAPGMTINTSHLYQATIV